MTSNSKSIKWISSTYREPPPPSASKPPPLPILPPFSIGRRRIGVCTDLSETSQSQVSVNNLQFFMKRILYHSCLQLNYLSSLWDNSLKIGLKTHKTKNTGHMSRSKWSLGGGGAGGNRCKRRLALFYKHFERHTGCKGRLSGVICRTCKSVNHCHQASKSGNVELLVTADKFSSFRSKEFVLTTESEYHEVVSCHSQSCTTYRFPIIDSKTDSLEAQLSMLPDPDFLSPQTTPSSSPGRII